MSALQVPPTPSAGAANHGQPRARAAHARARASVLVVCGLLLAVPACTGPASRSVPAASQVRAAQTTTAAATTGKAMTGKAITGADYVALGASFASGPGIPTRVPGSPARCGRSTGNYPHLLARRLHLALRDVTCEGATTAHVLTQQQHGQPPQIHAVDADTDLVTVTIGGNDVEYVGSLLRYSRCNTSAGTRCRAVDPKKINQALDGVEAKLEAINRETRRRAPLSRIVFVDYFTVLPPTGPACAGVPLTAEQLRFERRVAQRLNAAIRQAAVDSGAQLVTISEATRAHHHVCGSQPYIEKYDPEEIRASYHPTAAGMAKVADLIVDLLRS